MNSQVFVPAMASGGGGGFSGGTVPNATTFSSNVIVQGTLDVTGVATFTTTVNGSGDIMAGAAFAHGWTGRARIYSSADAVIEFRNAANNANASGTFLNVTATGDIRAGSGLTIGFTSGAKMYSPSDGKVALLTNGGGTGTEYIFGLTGSLLYYTTAVCGPGDGTGGTGDFTVRRSTITAGTMTKAAGNDSLVRRSITKFTWTNAMVTALGAVTTGDILVGTLPAKFVVTNVLMVVDTAETALTSLTGSVGRTGALYVDYLGNGSLKAAANTVYGDADAERGSNMSPTKAIDLPSYTGTTAVNLHLISGVENLSTAVACTGTVLIEGYLLP